MDIEIITIGDELLIGQTVDTNSVYLAKILAPLGFQISRKTAIRDQADAIKNALSESLTRVNMVLITGGLGPTNDDITQSVLQEYFNCGVRTDETVLNHLKEIFKNRDPRIFELNKKQALLPDACITLFNSQGTAPGMLFEHNHQWIAAMPGVPGEVRAIMEESFIPYIRPKFNLGLTQHRTLTTLMVPESVISHKLQHFESNLKGASLAYLPSYNAVKLRLTQTHHSLTQADFNGYWEQLKVQLGDWLFDDAERELNEWLVYQLKQRNYRIATAESCTGGFIGNQIVRVSGASDVFPGGIIAYDNRIKTELLHVNAQNIMTYGAVSAEVAEEMVTGVCERFQTEVGIATTGIAGPNGGTLEKPVGTIFIGIKVNEHINVTSHVLRGSRHDFMIRAFNTSMKLLKEML
jgi:nicotinamide-nucleotide amidase